MQLFKLLSEKILDAIRNVRHELVVKRRERSYRLFIARQRKLDRR